MSITRLEQHEGTLMVPYLSGDTDLRWEEEEFTGYLWRDNKCGLVWTRKHQAQNCADRGHTPFYVDQYFSAHRFHDGPDGRRVYDPIEYRRSAVRRDSPRDGDESRVPANARRLPASKGVPA